MDSAWPEQLAAGLEAMEADLSPRSRLLLLDYLALLFKWNRAYNLTAVRDPAVAVSRQLLDSLSILPLVAGERVLDVGSGAGLPGLPLAVARPEWRVTLLDSNAKKVRFLRQAKLQLGLDNLEVAQARAEGYRPGEPFDTITSRAFAPLARMVAVTGHLLVPGGRWLAMKGRVPEDELEELPSELAAEVVPLQVPGEQGQRHAVIVSRVPGGRAPSGPSHGSPASGVN